MQMNVPLVLSLSKEESKSLVINERCETVDDEDDCAGNISYSQVLNSFKRLDIPYAFLFVARRIIRFRTPACALWRDLNKEASTARVSIRARRPLAHWTMLWAAKQELHRKFKVDAWALVLACEGASTSRVLIFTSLLRSAQRVQRPTLSSLMFATGQAITS
jgi:hypothetical protein